MVFDPIIGILYLRHLIIFSLAPSLTLSFSLTLYLSLNQVPATDVSIILSTEPIFATIFAAGKYDAAVHTRLHIMLIDLSYSLYLSPSHFLHL